MREAITTNRQLEIEDRQDAFKIMTSFLLSGLKTKDDDRTKLMIAIRNIMKSTEGERKEAVNKYHAFHDFDLFITTLIPIYNRILYDAYAPYWLSHCMPVNDCDAVVDFTYYNDLIDMYWAAPWQEWKRKDKWEVMLLLPPTKGLISLQRQKDEQSHQ